MTMVVTVTLGGPLRVLKWVLTGYFELQIYTFEHVMMVYEVCYAYIRPLAITILHIICI